MSVGKCTKSSTAPQEIEPQEIEILHSLHGHNGNKDGDQQQGIPAESCAPPQTETPDHGLACAAAGLAYQHCPLAEHGTPAPYQDSALLFAR